jgi:hypothetical protein
MRDITNSPMFWYEYREETHRGPAYFIYCEESPRGLAIVGQYYVDVLGDNTEKAASGFTNRLNAAAYRWALYESVSLP